MNEAFSPARAWPGHAIALVLSLTSIGLSLSACSGPVQPQTDLHADSAVAAVARQYPAWTQEERSRLIRDLDAEFASVEKSRDNGLVVLAADGSRLFDRNGEAPRTPASTLKVLTAATSLAIFGPAHRFTTRVSALHAPQAGTLNGNLWLIGGGDPVLTSDDLRAGAVALAHDGLRRIEGRVIVDASAFAGPEQNPHWAPDDLNLDYAAGTSALSLDEDVAIFAVRPTVVGAPAAVRLLPANPVALLHGQIITYPASGAPGVRIDHAQGQNSFTLSGGIASGEEQRFPIPIGDVARYVAGVFDALLARHGITSAGKAETGLAPIGAGTLWLHRSPPLRDIVHGMLIVSDNHVAEQLLRLIATTSGYSGTERSGIKAERAFLTRIGVSDAGLRIYDGSGLAPADRIAPLTIAAVLADAGARPGNPLVLGLPRVGVEGTVRGHTLTAAQGRVRAKSGHISGVDGLVGVVESRRHGPLAFAFIGNDVDDATIEDAEDKALDTLSNF